MPETTFPEQFSMWSPALMRVGFAVTKLRDDCCVWTREQAEIFLTLSCVWSARIHAEGRETAPIIAADPPEALEQLAEIISEDAETLAELAAELREN